MKEKRDECLESIINTNRELFSILIQDRTTKANIIWATDDYFSNGIGFAKDDYMTLENSSGDIIKPRSQKSKIIQNNRSKNKAEVYTPSWICNIQNNLIDKAWFNAEGVFNIEIGTTWITNKNKIEFPIIEGKTWMDYVESMRIEMSCGEAPYLVSRYDAITGKTIGLTDRIGLLDRKLRVINENVDEEEMWITWAMKAYKSIYAYEWQGDNLLIARKNLLETFYENYEYKFNEKPDISLLKEIAFIISWNVWQMDGVRFVVPNSCINKVGNKQTTLFEDRIDNRCAGCEKNTYDNHTGIYCRIMDWQAQKSMKFVSLLKRSELH